MPTLNELRRVKFKTVKAFAEAGNITLYQAGNWLHARYGCWYIEAPENAHILALFGVTLEEYKKAWYETDEEEKRLWREKYPVTEETRAAHEASFKAYADARWEKMSDAEKRYVHEEAKRLGLVQERRSPLDILIDRVVGKE